MLRSVALAICAVAGLAGPVRADGRDVSELFDPGVLARNLCGHDDAPARIPGLEQLAVLPAPDALAKRPPLYKDLGTLTFPIPTAKPEAQAYFNQGIRLTYGFNHGEAIRAFRAAQAIDPACAICFWGEALNLGPNINGPMRQADNATAVAAARRAMQLLSAKTPAKERALITAVAVRYAAKPPQSRDKLDAAYADAMKKAYQAFPNDPDIAISYAEAAMVASTWPWFEKGTNKPIGRIGDAMAAIEGVLAADPHNPGAIHYYIHLAETPAPEKAELYADQLGALMPGVGHMVHMPSHIYFRVGRYKDSLAVNLKAIDLDAKLIADVPETADAYRYGLYPHNINMAMASASMAGDAKAVLALADRMDALAVRMTQDLSPDDERLDGILAQTIMPRLRFEDPAVTIARPMPGEKMPISLGLWHYARGSALAWKKDVAGARAEVEALAKFRAAQKKPGHLVAQLFELGEEVLRARIAMAEGDMEAAKHHFETAVEIEEREQLYRGDPPPWDVPLRQSLGVLLLNTGHPAEAVPLLRQALIDTPNNGWALYALQQAAAATGDTLGAAEYGKLFTKAWLGAGPPDLSRL